MKQLFKQELSCKEEIKYYFVCEFRDDDKREFIGVAVSKIIKKRRKRENE